jgi:hypothetical protein
MQNDSVAIALTKAEALILFDLLADLHEDPSLKVRDQADRVALWNLTSLLEKSLAEVLSPNYRELVAQARVELTSGRT